MEALSSGIKRLGHKADHSPPSSTEIKNVWNCTSRPPNFHGVLTGDAFNMFWLSALPCSKTAHVCQHSGTCVQSYPLTSGLGHVGRVYVFADSESLKIFTALNWKCKGMAMHIPPCHISSCIPVFSAQTCITLRAWVACWAAGTILTDRDESMRSLRNFAPFHLLITVLRHAERRVRQYARTVYLQK